MLGLNTAATAVQKINWTITSNYYVLMLPVNQQVQTATGWGVDEAFNDVLQLSIKNVDLPQHSPDLVEKMTAGKWHISRNEDELYVLSITFRDMWGGTLYRLFKNIWRIGKKNYPDVIKFNIQVFLTHSGKETTDKNFNPVCVYYSSEALLTSISQVQLSHENNEIMEFTLEFKSNEPAADYQSLAVKLDGTQKDLNSSNSTRNDFSDILSKASSKLTSTVTDYLKGASKSAGQTIAGKIKDSFGWD